MMCVSLYKERTMGKFDRFLICTDLDGTLLRNDKTISPENLQAIAYFKQEGGFFTFVTGRMPFFVSRVYDRIKPNAPIGCINGGGLYDYPNQTYLWQGTMPDGVVDLIRSVDEAVPNVGIQVNTFYHTYFSKENPVMREFRRLTGLPNLICPYTKVEEPIAKILFGCEREDEIRQVESILRSHPKADNFDFIRSERTLFEILPKGVGKGTAIRNLVNHLGLDINKTIAIGDYNNDISMFHAAKLGIAVSNACEEALAAADYITVSNEESAIARVIADLEAGKLPL
jgi:Cof subfamily protein (haloacid dehalogenase superfamily)